jgi:DNA-binding Xre family transcriptional regulator
VIRHTAPVLCLWLSKALTELVDADFDSAAEEAERLNVRASTRDRFAGRCLALRQLCFQDGIIDRPPRDSKAPARLPAEHAATIIQPDMFATTDLVPLLAARRVVLSREQVYRLVAQIPERLSLATLAALCGIFECTPDDLIEVIAAPRTTTKTATPGAPSRTSRPLRARVLRVEES